MEPRKTVARSIKERLANIVSYGTHRITNAVAEGINSKIMSIKRWVGGFRNIGNFQIATFFHCGGLDLLYPRSSRMAPNTSR
ncbi:transposase [Roseiconus lacunae]|uniref:Transposase n=1 Tax=Roseiconus lacunae TaxID=2605694 RepID=A0ABT7PPS7_9BACT|nr:transposase [Roseiconus lacunae]MDM4018505.1 transposase [Roseiconus lacunae]